MTNTPIPQAETAANSNTPPMAPKRPTRREKRRQKRYTPSKVVQVRGMEYWLVNTQETIPQFRIYQIIDVFPKTQKITIARLYATQQEAQQGYTPRYTIPMREFAANFVAYTDQATGAGMTEEELVAAADNTELAPQVGSDLLAETDTRDSLVPAGEAQVELSE